MKKFTATLSFAIFFLLALAPIAKSAEIKITLEEQPATGRIVFVLFDSANAFGDLRNPVKAITHELNDSKVYHIYDIPAGEYALLVYYDENNNGQIDKNFIGIPNEPLGFSNNYRPKGPPSYKRALFNLTDGEPIHFDIKLARPLGEFGSIGVGVGVIAQSSPYRDYDGTIYQVIPAITYIGDRLQIYGPFARYSIIGKGKNRLALLGQYRIGSYDENDSDYLDGMGDAESAFMMGLGLQSELPGGLGVSASYTHDLFNRIGGGEIKLDINKSFQLGNVRLTPSIGLSMFSPDLANNDFGVPADKATASRPAYELDWVLNLETGLGLFIEITSDWLFFVMSSVEYLDEDIIDSPIISEDYILKGFGGINYLF